MPKSNAPEMPTELPADWKPGDSPVILDDSETYPPTARAPGENGPRIARKQNRT